MDKSNEPSGATAPKGGAFARRTAPAGAGKSPPCPKLLRARELAGCIVTFEALHCQKTTAREIHEADAGGACPVRSHWSPEVSFDEDRTRHAAVNLATLRRITLKLLRTDRSSSKDLD